MTDKGRCGPHRRPRPAAMRDAANLTPGHQDTYVNYANPDRAPLLFVSATGDKIMPPKVQRSTARKYSSATVTDVVDYPGPHLLPARPGWEEVADFVLDWAVRHATG